MKVEMKNFIAESEVRIEEICQKVEQNQERIRLLEDEFRSSMIPIGKVEREQRKWSNKIIQNIFSELLDINLKI